MIRKYDLWNDNKGQLFALIHSSILHKCEPPHLLGLVIPIIEVLWYPCQLKGGKCNGKCNCDTGCK